MDDPCILSRRQVRLRPESAREEILCLPRVDLGKLYGPSPTGMGSFDEHVTVEEFLHVVKCHVLSAYDYLVRPG